MLTPPALFKFFALAFSALLPVVNPLGSTLVFLGLVGDAPSSVYRHLARTIAAYTVLFFLVVELVGTAILAFFGISLPVVQVAGGLVLASMGWALLNQRDPAPPGPAQVVPVSYGAIEEKVFYPLTFPVTVDPACIVVILTLSAILGAVMLLSILVYFCYAYAPRITAHIPAQTAHGILRIIAFVLFCIGVQISWNGVHAMIRVVMGLKG